MNKNVKCTECILKLGCNKRTNEKLSSGLMASTIACSNGVQARIFKFKSEETFWVVAKDVEEAKTCLIDQYNETEIFEDSKLEITELSRDEHIMISTEDWEQPAKMDIWDILSKDLDDADIIIPYMIASSLV